jgi:hypothetical protein
VRTAAGAVAPPTALLMAALMGWPPAARVLMLAVAAARNGLRGDVTCGMQCTAGWPSIHGAY